MTDALDQVLRLVADGRLTAEQAAPILDALSAADQDGPIDEERPDERREIEPAAGSSPERGGAATAIRIEITEGGRRVVNLRVPLSLGRMALDRIPGLSGANVDLVRQALSEGRSGTLVDIDEEDGGVRIGLE
jgi:hypothetical protein